MDESNGRMYISILIVVLIGLGLALAGSQGGASIGGFPLYALGVAIAFAINWIAFFQLFPACLRIFRPRS